MKAPLGLLLAFLLLAGCAAPIPSPSSPAPVSRSAEPAISIPSGVPKNTKIEPPADAFEQVVTKGKIHISGTCTELITDQLIWVLIGQAAAHVSEGQRVQVTGVPDPNRETLCSGSPLLVSSVAPVG